jgi:peptide/nickel transport system permease protein
VQATLVLATAIIEVAALSFLGLGRAQPDRRRVGPHAREVAGPAGDLARSSRCCPACSSPSPRSGFTLVGEALREALDPKFRR